MFENEMSVFIKQGIIDMVTQIVGMHFLLVRINFVITMYDHVPGSFFLAYFRVNVQDVFMQ